MMNAASPRRLPFYSGLMVLVLAFQIVGLARYLARLPEDLLGIGLYLVTIAAAVVAGSLCYLRWKRAQRHEA